MFIYLFNTLSMKGNTCCGSINTIAWVLLIIGGLNWGLVGFFEFDLVASIFGDMSVVARIIYVLVGLSALYLTMSCSKGCKTK